MTEKEVVNKAGQFIIQDASQKGEEATYLALFTRHKVGEKWIQDNGITTKKSCESPDFIFEVPNRPTVGLEIVKFIPRNSKNQATMCLERVAKKVVAHFKQQDFPLSLVIDVYDPREWSLNWAEHLDACYNPGFDHLNASDEELKEAFISALNLDEIKQAGITKKWIDLKGQKFVVTGCQMYAPHTSCHVNNMGRCLDNPFDELQQTIDSKNNKLQSYLANCDVCDLLVVVDGGFVNFEGIQKYKFNSVFRNVYLLDLSFGCKVTELKI